MVIGETIGPYTVIDKLGEGGMGEVYRAADTKLKRHVALKVLPAAFAADPDRLTRFEREAQVLASLNHPNIAAIYGLESSSGRTALVMELVDGPTLAELLGTASAPLPPDDVWAIARQIADALEAAHAHGIVHRDLKPANVKVRADGTVKVLDFGLAKAVDSTLSTQPTRDLANSPTITSPVAMTTAGMILGTAAYMAPEQARGRAVDQRADIWAFGVVLYELLTGISPFAGETVTDVLAAVVTRDPDLGRAPARFRRLLASCLQKDPRRRLRDIGDLELLLDDGAAPATTAQRAVWLPWSLAAALTLAIATATWLYLRGAAPVQPPLVQFEVANGIRNVQSGLAAVSPDGRAVAYYAGGRSGGYRVHVRRLDSVDERAIEAAEVPFGAQRPFWSPDGQYVAFWSGSNSLMKVRVPDGSPEEIIQTEARVQGGTWNRDDVLVLGAVSVGLRQVAARGGPVVQLTTPERSAGDRSDVYPEFLPDGRHVIFMRGSANPERAGVWVVSIDKPTTARRLGDATAASYAGEVPGFGPALLLVRNNRLILQPIDLNRIEFTGQPQDVMPIGTAGFSVSQNGTLVYGGVVLQRPGRLTWFDRSGTALSAIGPERPYLTFDLSPKGERITFALSRAGGGGELWTRDLARGTDLRLSSERDGGALWSPDGSRLILYSYREGPASLFEQPSNGTGAARLVLKQDRDIFGNDWSRDGRFVMYSMVTDVANLMDLFTVAMDEPTKKPTAYITEPFHQKQAQFSPNGKFVAYMSDETGRAEVYVRTFPDASVGKWPISSDGGVEPRWSPDGRELFYWSGQTLMAAAVSTAPTFSAGPSRALFDAPIQPDYLNDGHSSREGHAAPVS